MFTKSKSLIIAFYRVQKNSKIPVNRRKLPHFKDLYPLDSIKFCKYEIGQAQNPIIKYLIYFLL